MKTFLVSTLFCAFGIFVQTSSVYAQFEKQRAIADAFPVAVEGFESDKPIITYEESQKGDNIRLEKMYYRTDDSEEIHIIIEEFNTNANYFKRQYNSIQQQADSVGDPEFYYKGYLKQERDDEEMVKKVIYLDPQLILTITHTGDIKNKNLVDELLGRIDLEEIVD